MRMKYIMIDDYLPILFSQGQQHSEMVGPNQKVTSAGFVTFSIENGKFEAYCSGQSTSLGVKSNPEKDNVIIARMLNSTLPY